MEESTNGSEESISMGPADLLSCDEASNEPVPSVVTNSSFFSPPKNSVPHAMGHLSISSISTADSSHVHLHAAFSPESDFRPDILMSTVVNSKQASVSQEDLSISIGPLPVFDGAHETQCEEDPELFEEPITSLAAKIQKFEVKQKISAQKPQTVLCDSKGIQTDVFHCQKCEELHIHYNQKLLEVANEFQQQYVSQFQMAEQHAAASEDAQRQIGDLMDQLDGADKQLKANRAFLEQQAIEREQEREEANEQQKKLEALLTEKEKESERAKTSASQLSLEVQQLQEAIKEKDKAIQELLSSQHRLEDQNEVLRMNQVDMDEENTSLQTILDVKDKLLKAQSEQIAALQNELENQLYAPSETERESDVPASRKHDSTLQDVVDTSLPATAAEMPSLFDELQQLIVRLLHKVDNSTRALEAAQATAQKKIINHLLSPRSQVLSPSTSTEDISIKDRNPRDLRGVRDTSPTPTEDDGQNNPERALNFLQQLDGKLAILNRIEEAACKRIADLEAELQRVAQSEKRSISRAAELEQQYQQHQLLLQDVDAERHELQSEHTELLKRISSLENRLEEQRRSAALGASQNVHAEKCKTLSEEKQHLELVVKEKEESLADMQKQMSQLHQRIDKLMKAIQEKEQEATRRTQDDFSQSSVERLRDAHHQDGSMTWSKLHVQSSPVPLSPIYQAPLHHQQPKHQEMSHAVYLELDELKTKLAKSEKERQILEDEAACNAIRLTQLESVERRNAALDDIVDEAERKKNEYQERCTCLEKELEDYCLKLKDLELIQARCVSLEKELSGQKLMEKELETARLSYGALEKELVAQKQTSQAAIDQLRNHCKELETHLADNRNIIQEYDIIRRRCIALETEAAAQRGTITAVEVLQQRCATLQAELVYNQQATQQQYSSLKFQLDSKEQMVKELQSKLKFSDSCKVKVEEALRKLQQEVEAIKQAQLLQQQKQMSARTADPRELSTLLEGPSAPPDLLAPSFIEFLGSATSSRCSSRAASMRGGSPAHRTAESSTFNDLSLPNSMMGKTTLKEVQRESEQLLAFGKQLLELQQQNAAQQKKDQPPPVNQTIEDDLEVTLKPDSESFEAAPSPVEIELMKKVQLLETELAMERLLLQDQRTSNTRLQQQVLHLVAQQRSNPPAKPQQPQKVISSFRSLQPEQAGKFQQYRALKLESIRKNLIYQKKFLSGIVQEWEKIRNQRIEEKSVPKKPYRRFRAAVFTVISIQRMRFIVRQWRQRRRSIEA